MSACSHNHWQRIRPARNVNHSLGEYVRGGAHTNTIEGYFSILKCGINGAYHHVSQQHLKRYLPISQRSRFDRSPLILACIPDVGSGGIGSAAFDSVILLPYYVTIVQR
jgi:hypothetical protein